MARTLKGFLTTLMIFAGFLIFRARMPSRVSVLERVSGRGGLRVFWAVQCA